MAPGVLHFPSKQAKVSGGKQISFNQQNTTECGPEDLSSPGFRAGELTSRIVTDRNALSLPPHISADQVEGFGVAMMKLTLSGHIDEVVDTVEASIRHI